MNRRRFLMNSMSFSLAALFGQNVLAGMNFRPPHQLNDRNALQQDIDIYVQGEDKVATWLYAGFLPRVQNARQVEIVASYWGLTVRVSMALSRADVERYADYVCARAAQIEAIRLESGNEAFKVLDPDLYTKFTNILNAKFKPVLAKQVVAGALGNSSVFVDNLKLLREFFPKSLFLFDANNQPKELEQFSSIADIRDIRFHIVFPTTPMAEKVPEEFAPLVDQYGLPILDANGEPREDTNKPIAWSYAKDMPASHVYQTQNLDERRSLYNPERLNPKKAHLFGGFPAFWFNANVGFHGPIRWVDPENSQAMLDGYLSDTGAKPQKKVSKRWQLHRVHESHGCFRMEHVLALRAMLPSRESELKRVNITVIYAQDLFDIDRDGVQELMGVNYYWQAHTQRPKSGETFEQFKQRQRAEWIAKYYKGFKVVEYEKAKANPALGQQGTRLFEFPYTNPGAVQIEPRPGMSSYKLMTRLNQAPFGEEI